MKMMRKALAMGGLCLALAACGGDTLKPAMDAMKAGDLGRAEQLLDQEAKRDPERKPLHALRFVLYRHLSVHGDNARQPEYLQKAIGEYDALAQGLGLKPDYADMEGSLNGNAEGASLLKNARRPLYGDQ